jgi:hypothetical protein
MIWRWPSQNTFRMWTVLYWTRSSRTQFGVSINVWRLVGDTLNITCNFLYCKHQVHLYIAVGRQMTARISRTSNLYFSQSIWRIVCQHRHNFYRNYFSAWGSLKRFCTFSDPWVASLTSGTRYIILNSSCDGFYPLVGVPLWPLAPSGAQFH